MHRGNGGLKTRLGIICILVAIPAFCANAPASGRDDTQAPTTEEVLTRAIDAMGGTDALEKIKSAHFTYSLRAGDQTRSLDVFSRNPDHFVQTSPIAGGTATDGYNGEVCWHINCVGGRFYSCELHEATD